jgi:hypothetical protein
MAAPQALQSDIVRFPFNVPQLVSIRFARPKLINTKMGERAMYTLTDGRVMFLEPRTAEAIEVLDIRPGQDFYVAKRSNKDRGEYWDVWIPPVGKGAEGSCDLPSVPSSKCSQQKNPEVPATTIPASQAAWAQEVLEHAKTKLTMYHELCGWAKQNLEGISRNEVRAILMNCLISSEKGVRR